MAVLVACDLGHISLDDPVRRWLPSFQADPPDGSIRIADLLRHEAPLLRVDGNVNTSMTRKQAVSLICAGPPDANRPLGQSGYLGHAGMLIASACVEAATGVDFINWLQDTVLDRGAAGHSSLGPLPTRVVPVPFIGVPPTRVTFDRSRAFPSNGIAGPMAAAANTLRAARRSPDRPILTERALANLSRQIEPAKPDDVYGIDVAWTYGAVVDAFFMGAHRSTRAYGHLGSRCVCVFSDPDYDLDVAIFVNAIGPRDHSIQLLQDLASDVYVDLDIPDGRRASQDPYPNPAGSDHNHTHDSDSEP